jgi:hypothetical protein
MVGGRDRSRDFDAINTGGQSGMPTTKNLRQGIAGGFGGLASSRLWLLEACLVDTL